MKLNQVGEAVREAVADGLPSKLKTMNRAFSAIVQARVSGYSHKQIYDEIIKAGFALEFEYYRNIYYRIKAREKQNQKTREQPTKPEGSAQRAAQAEKPMAGASPARPETMAEELKRIRKAGRVDYSKYLKRNAK